MERKWFGVKTLYRSEAVGEAIATDEDFDKDVTLVEERVVLIRACSHNEAIERAEDEAVEYARPSHVNPYGQTVVQRYLGECDSYELFDTPAKDTPSGSEVFSTTALVSTECSDEDLVSQRMGPDEGDRPDPRRRKFLDRDFSGVVGEPEAHEVK